MMPLMLRGVWRAFGALVEDAFGIERVEEERPACLWYERERAVAE